MISDTTSEYAVTSHIHRPICDLSQENDRSEQYSKLEAKPAHNINYAILSPPSRLPFIPPSVGDTKYSSVYLPANMIPPLGGGAPVGEYEDTMVMKGAMLGGVATDDRVKSPSATTIQQPTYTVVSKVMHKADTKPLPPPLNEGDYEMPSAIHALLGHASDEEERGNGGTLGETTPSCDSGGVMRMAGTPPLTSPLKEGDEEIPAATHALLGHAYAEERGSGGTLADTTPM